MSGLASAFAVLMIGHSLFGTEGPGMLQDALRAGGSEAEVQAQIINGAPLSYQWENGSAAQGVHARGVLEKGQTSHLILTEALPLANHIKWSQSGEFAAAYAGLAFDGNPQTHVYVQETWHDLKSGTGAPIAYDAGADVAWRQRLDDDLPAWEGIVDAIRDRYPEQAAQVRLIPAGQAMARLSDAIEADQIAGLTSINALFADDIHLNDLGHYFVSMVQFAALSGLSPLGLPSDFKDQWGGAYDLPDVDLARDLQRIAWEAVRAYGGPVDQVQNANTPSQSAAGPRGPPVGVSGKMAVGLAPVFDWSTQNPFLNILKTARPWIGHRPGQWGGMSAQELLAAGLLDDNGWPKRLPRSLGSIGTLVLTNMPTEAHSLTGRYVLRFAGSGIIEVGGLATNMRYAPGEVRFDYIPGEGSVDIRLQRIDPADPLRDITLVKEEMLERFDAGEVFNPAWTQRLKSFGTLRFMDWMQTNNSMLARWENRPQPDDYVYSTGVPAEVMIDLANALGRDPWFNIPHLADDEFVRAFAMLVKERLNTDLRAYVEFSNEVWNWGFAQAQWADAKATARWGKKDSWVQYYGLRAAEVAAIWRDGYGEEADARLVNVISTQTGWLGLEEAILRAPLAVEEGSAPPHVSFDAYAVSGYFGGILGGTDRAELVDGWLEQSAAHAERRAAEEGLIGDDAKIFVAQHRFDLATEWAAAELRDGALSGSAADTLDDLTHRIWPHHAQVARDHDLTLIMYEGGTHVAGHAGRENDAEVTAFFNHLNYSPQMAALYQTLLDRWFALGGQMFNAYSDVDRASKWGSWGGLRHLDDTNPRWDVLVKFQ